MDDAAAVPGPRRRRASSTPTAWPGDGSCSATLPPRTTTTRSSGSSTASRGSSGGTPSRSTTSTHDGLFALELFDTVEADLHQPPVHTRSWFHTGAYVGADRISRQLATGVLGRRSGGLAAAGHRPAAGLTPGGVARGGRALRGRPLREEVYAIDGSAAGGDIPYTVTETNVTVRLLQPSGRDRARRVPRARPRDAGVPLRARRRLTRGSAHDARRSRSTSTAT